MPLPKNPKAQAFEHSHAKFQPQPPPPPVAQDDALTSVAEDSGLRLIPIASLLGNDSTGPLTITAVSNAVGGTVTINGSNIEFTPTADFSGAASFDYTVSDNGQTDTGSVSFAITEVNDAPVATDDALTSVAEDSGKRTISFDSLLGNDSTGPAQQVRPDADHHGRRQCRRRYGRNQWQQCRVYARCRFQRHGFIRLHPLRQRSDRHRQRLVRGDRGL